jgi:putative ABC transport system permease protein
MKFLIRAPIMFVRLLYQSVYLALSQIWANKTRSMLTTLGIIIGVASVTAVIAALSGLKAKILTQVESLGTNTIFISARRPDRGPMQHVSWWSIRFLPEHFDGILEHCPSVARFGRQTWVGRYTVSHRDKSSEGVTVRGVEPACHQIDHRPVTIGRPLSVIDEMQVRQVCLIDPKLRNDLNLDRDCIGQTVLIGHDTFYIVGVVEPRPENIFGGGNQESSEIFIPFKVGLKMQRYPSIWALAESKSAKVSDDALAEIRFFLRRMRNIKPGEPDTFQVQSLQNELQTFNEITVIVTLVAGGIVGISLLVGGVGIMNIMLVSVSERTREIGLRKAVGAKNSAILTQFMIESIVLCCMGGLVGIVCGQLLITVIDNIVRAAFHVTVLDMAYIPAWAIALSFAFAGSVGIFFGMFPAIKASRLDPIEALRHE